MKPDDYNIFIVIVLFHLRHPEEVCRAASLRLASAPVPGACCGESLTSSRGSAQGPGVCISTGDPLLSNSTLCWARMDAKLSLSFYSQDLNVV